MLCVLGLLITDCILNILIFWYADVMNHLSCLLLWKLKFNKHPVNKVVHTLSRKGERKIVSDCIKIMK
jgi:hypothetical protein